MWIQIIAEVVAELFAKLAGWLLEALAIRPARKIEPEATPPSDPDNPPQLGRSVADYILHSDTSPVEDDIDLSKWDTD